MKKMCFRVCVCVRACVVCTTNGNICLSITRFTMRSYQIVCQMQKRVNELCVNVFSFVTRRCSSMFLANHAFSLSLTFLISAVSCPSRHNKTYPTSKICSRAGYAACSIERWVDTSGCNLHSPSQSTSEALQLIRSICFLVN